MKKFLISAMAIASVGLGLTSCSSDEPIVGGEGDGSGKITFVAQLPAELGSRAFSDGTSANTLQYFVYKHGEKTVILNGTENNFNLTANVELQLVNGESYDVVFLAQSSTVPEGLYTYTPDTQNFTVDYTKAVQNNDNCDAFYAIKTVTVTGGNTQSVDLKRPFAQINFGTNDAATEVVTSAYGTNLANLTTTLGFEAQVPTTLNLVSGTLSGTASVNLGAAGVPEQSAFPAGGTAMDGYRYLSMNYILAPQNENDVNNLTFNVLRGETVMNTVKVPNVPMRANYQTNIYGALLTSATNFTVTIKPAFAAETNLPQNLPTGSALVGNTVYHNINDALAAAAPTGEPVMLAPSDYNVKNITWPASGTVNLVGVSPEKTSVSNIGYQELPAGLEIVMSNLTLETEINQYNHTSMGFKNIKSAVYNNVTFNGEHHAFASESETFNNCTFKFNEEASKPQGSGHYNMYYETPVNLVVNKCTFTNKYNKGILVYNSNANDVHKRNVTVTDCTFTAEEPQYGNGNVLKERGAVEIHTEQMRNMGGNVIITNSTCNDIYTKGLWYEVNNNTNTHSTLFNVTVNGVKVQTAATPD